MLDAQITASPGDILTQQQIDDTLAAGLSGRFSGERVLVLIPDRTRTLPLPQLFRRVVELLSDARQLDFMVALGTHPALGESAMHDLVGITAEERATTFGHIDLLNHAWDNPETLVQIGTVTREEVQAIAGPYWHHSLGGDVPVRINRAVLDYDRMIILGPTFPHEVVGFSGGAKYLFPGISGPEMINVTHWLGALITILDMIGIADTPVRTLINAAATSVRTPITLASLVVEGKELSGVFVGDLYSAWQAAADLSSTRHILWVDKPYQRVLSCAPPMYDELWTAAKAMYKLEPVIADGGEIIVYAPHLKTISHAHGTYIYEIGYHIRDYFLDQWDQFKHIPLGVLAHSTHFRGSGTYDSSGEKPRIRVTLASQISPEDCAKLSLGYQDPTTIDPAEWQRHAAEDTLVVPKAGEMLYRLNKQAGSA